MAINESELTAWLHSEIFHYLPLNIAVIDRNYNIVEANRNFERCFGAWQKGKCHEVYKRRSLPCPDCRAMQTFQDGLVRIHEEEGRDAQGKLAFYVVHMVPVFAPDGTVSHVIEMSHNITDVPQQERAYHALFEKVPCYIAILDRDLHIVRSNQKLRNTFGECEGKHCYEEYKKRDGICDNCPALMSFRDGKEHTSTQVGISKDGKETHYIVSTSPLLEKGQDTHYLIEILTDITHMKALEKERLDAERLAAVGETVSGLAHSIKNILMGIDGGMYLMNSGFKKDDRQRVNEGWQILERNLGRVSSMMRAFLGFAKGRCPEMKETDPNALVEDIIRLYRETAKNAGVALERREKKTIAHAPMDPEGIHECLGNLVSNAIDACRSSTKPDALITLDVDEKNGSIIFEVSDNGCGMDYEIKKKVFSTFYTTKTTGTGLGLLTTRKIVQEHGGKIHVESTPNEGSVFRIEMPRQRLEEISGTGHVSSLLPSNR